MALRQTRRWRLRGVATADGAVSRRWTTGWSNNWQADEPGARDSVRRAFEAWVRKVQLVTGKDEVNDLLVVVVQTETTSYWERIASATAEAREYRL